MGKAQKGGDLGGWGLRSLFWTCSCGPVLYVYLVLTKLQHSNTAMKPTFEESGHLEHHHVPVTVFVCLIFPFSNESILNTLADKHSEIPWHHPNNVEYGDVASLLCYYHY